MVGHYGFRPRDLPVVCTLEPEYEKEGKTLHLLLIELGLYVSDDCSNV